MTRDRIMALVALAALAAFFGVVVFKLWRVDLFFAAGLGLLLAGYDIWLSLKPRRRTKV